ncbi:hypothetical protein HMPREF7545_1707 [Selenomonas noxia ATCC 43541]|uniref:hypothetical protein n=1 Tax=Selenomonas noxia TaxID=135083 RepID=UPI0001BCECF5|nr:hypothetical protein [Selenomonas noxia]EFF65336.1 hypothetical protein HMPREF7545_1707 [Selenomonas noxia ATCC 43541]
MKKLVLFFVITIFVMLSANVGYAEATWEKLSETEKSTIYFNLDDIHYELKNDPMEHSKKTVDTTKITYWEKEVFTKEGAEEYAKRVGDSRFNELDYALTLQTYDIIQNTVTYRRFIYYNQRGDILNDDKINMVIKITPDSRGTVVAYGISFYAELFHDKLVHNSRFYDFSPNI